MILVDSSVWIDHFRHAEPRLEALLVHELASLHPFVLGELACGSLHKRSETIAYFVGIPPLVGNRLRLDRYASPRVGSDRGGLRLWTVDRAMAAAAKVFGIAFPDSPTSA
jgi:predicted nucleic acid-binding protein